MADTFRTLPNWTPPAVVADPVQLPSGIHVAPPTMRPAPRATLPEILAAYYRPTPQRSDWHNARVVALAALALLAVPALHVALCLIP